MSKKGSVPTKKRKKGAKKKFFDVSVPLTGSKAKLFAFEPSDLDGCIIKLDLTRNLRGKNVELRSRVKFSDGELSAELFSLRFVQSYLKRVLRRGVDYVEDSFVTDCKDAKLRIKPFLITRHKVSRAVRREVRNVAHKFLVSHTTIRTVDELFSEIMTGKLQKELSLKVKKIYPLGFCDIRHIEILGPADKKVAKKTPEKVEEPAKESVGKEVVVKPGE